MVINKKNKKLKKLYLEQFTESTEVQREHCSSEDWERKRFTGLQTK